MNYVRNWKIFEIKGIPLIVKNMKQVCAVAAPIFNRSGKVIAALGCPSPMSRMTPERISEIAEAFKEAVKAISQRMGYNQ